MTWPATETQKTIYGILSTDAALQTLLGGTPLDPKIYDFVPDNKPYPYIKLNIRPWTDRANHTKDGFAAEPTIDVFYRAPGRGDLKVQQIQKRVDELLHNTDICVEGWNIIVFRRAFIDIMTEPDNVTLHGIQKFKLFLGEA